MTKKKRIELRIYGTVPENYNMKRLENYILYFSDLKNKSGLNVQRVDLINEEIITELD